MSWLKIRLKICEMALSHGREGRREGGKVHAEEINVTFDLFSDIVWFYPSGY
jgi:hypothetical protein